MTLPPDDFDKSIGLTVAQRIQSELDKRGWSLRELARRADVSPMLISDVLRGESAISLTTAIQLAAAFELSVDAFVPEDCQKNQATD